MSAAIEGVDLGGLPKYLVMHGSRRKAGRACWPRCGKGTLQYCVLALLADEEHYGFDLVRSLAETDGMVTSEGTIYPLLSRLRRDGLVETTWRESTTGPPRRYYRLTTPDGRRSPRSWTNGSRFRDAVDHFVERKAG